MLMEFAISVATKKDANLILEQSLFITICNRKSKQQVS